MSAEKYLKSHDAGNTLCIDVPIEHVDSPPAILDPEGNLIPLKTSLTVAIPMVVVTVPTTLLTRPSWLALHIPTQKAAKK